VIKEIRYYRFPSPLINEQQSNPITRDLYFTEIGEIEIEKGTIWENPGKQENHLLAFCTKGKGILEISNEQVAVKEYQFFVVPKEEYFKFFSELNETSRYLVILFNGKKTHLLSNRFSVVRSLVPSVNNLVANREMLFQEIFNNLSKGFHDQNLVYVNFCFGHLLATFLYANKTSDDLLDESNPSVRKAIDFMNKNLDKKLSLQQIADEAGYSSTYFTTLFRKETNYAPLSYFSHLKILQACEFLDHTKVKIKQISFKLGYSDPYYFTKDFKKKMGLSPRQYRNRVK